MTQSPRNDATPSGLRLYGPLTALTGVALLVLAALAVPRSSAEPARAAPAPALDVNLSEATSAVAVLAGGCFWGVQGVFQHVKGVSNAVSGYAGGEAATAHYDMVGMGTTGHAESVKVTYDPRQISYGQILQIYFSVAHDPTQLNRQGPDVGTQYRSEIFYTTPEQQQVSEAYIAQLDAAHTFSKPIATRADTHQQAFYPAEEYHQD